MAGQVGNDSGDVGFQIAPMVDVVFVLVLFFMASAGMQQKEMQLGITLPASGAGLSDGTPSPPVFIDIRPDAQVEINAQGFDDPTSDELPQLTAYLREAIIGELGADQAVIIRPSPNTPHERVIDVLNAASKAGVTRLTFS